MPYDPTQAGDPTPRKFKNVLKCIANEIITMAEAVSRGRYRSLPDGVGENEPYWDLCFETLDARRVDGSPLSIPTCGRLFTKEGKRQDNTQRPYRVSIAFAGEAMGKISIFPGDPEGKFDSFCASFNEDPIGTNPSYDASKVVGRVFICEMEPMEIGRDMPIPLTAEGEGYVYTGKVREVAPRADSGVNPDGTAAPVSNALVDIAKPGGEDALKQVLDLISGQPADADFFEVLRTGGLDNRTLFDGESVLGLAVNEGALTKKLVDLSLASVGEDGRIAITS